ncbi:DUF1735 domain-containing protein [Sphingobacterium olei]|uniref:DUF1735 domain-containing protein n=1 Tax=Sphingobacterium olei TaxID=2571155 RepID=A0A4U0NGM9_9SPHI|nr:DUF5627 domain-containing protein [Sphingobacterium olei]TJZ53299.1 DUF1735 domain-containing protein [Sphingobacterium olei]
MKRILIFSAMLLLAFISCKNQDWEFPDFEYQTIYFAYQYPVRTITMGEDIFDTSLDNQGKVNVMATTGGVYSNKQDITIDFVVDNAMTENITYGSGGADVQPLPSNYYTLASNKIVIPKGKPSGGVEVQLTDAFFADPKAVHTTYVLPIRLTGVASADSILSGTPSPGSLLRKAVADDWDIAPKDYTFYAIKYINTWHGNYLRRGQDVIVGKNGNTSLSQTQVRREAFVEKDEVKSLSTQSLKNTILPLTFKDVDGTNINFNLILSFDNNNNCSVSSGTTGITASGNGKFIKRGEKNSWGNTDRDAMYLEYQIDMAQMSISTKDTLVMRDRGVKMETFSVALKP